MVIVLVSVYTYQLLQSGLARAGAGDYPVSQNLNVSKNFNLLVFKVSSFKNPTASVDFAAVLNFQVKGGALNILILPASQFSAEYGLSNLAAGMGRAPTLRASFSKALGMPIDGAVYTDDGGFKEISRWLNLNPDSLGQGKNVLTNASLLARLLASLGTGVRTDLSLPSILSLAKFLEFDFPAVVSSYQVSDVLGDPGRLDLLLKSNFSDPQVQAEGLSVIVLNGTSKAGLAGDYGRLVSNLGLNLLSADNAPGGRLYQSSFMIVQSQNYYSVRRLAEIFGIEDLRRAADLASDPDFGRLLRADIVLVLGADQLNR